MRGHGCQPEVLACATCPSYSSGLCSGHRTPSEPARPPMPNTIWAAVTPFRAPSTSQAYCVLSAGGNCKENLNGDHPVGTSPRVQWGAAMKHLGQRPFRQHEGAGLWTQLWAGEGPWGMACH